MVDHQYSSSPFSNKVFHGVSSCFGPSDILTGHVIVTGVFNVCIVCMILKILKRSLNMALVLAMECTSTRSILYIFFFIHPQRLLRLALIPNQSVGAVAAGALVVFLGEAVGGRRRVLLPKGVEVD